MFICCIFKYGESLHDYNLNNFGFLDTFTKYIFRNFEPMRPRLTLKFAKNAKFHADFKFDKKVSKHAPKSLSNGNEYPIQFFCILSNCNE